MGDKNLSGRNPLRMVRRLWLYRHRKCNPNRSSIALLGLPQLSRVLRYFMLRVVRRHSYRSSRQPDCSGVRPVCISPHIRITRNYATGFPSYSSKSQSASCTPAGRLHLKPASLLRSDPPPTTRKPSISGLRGLPPGSLCLRKTGFAFALSIGALVC